MFFKGVLRGNTQCGLGENNDIEIFIKQLGKNVGCV